MDMSFLNVDVASGSYRTVYVDEPAQNDYLTQITDFTVRCTLHAQIELHDALEHARSEKRAEQERALAVIQEEENQARERCKVRFLN